MDLIKIENQHQIRLLINDHCPNQAMRNEFQTQTFSFKIHRLEWMKECEGYQVDEGGIFLHLPASVSELVTNEILSFSKNNILISYDNEEPYEAEENFGVLAQLRR